MDGQSVFDGFARTRCCRGCPPCASKGRAKLFFLPKYSPTISGGVSGHLSGVIAICEVADPA
jgi:hypothetical protein